MALAIIGHGNISCKHIPVNKKIKNFCANGLSKISLISVFHKY